MKLKTFTDLTSSSVSTDNSVWLGHSETIGSRKRDGKSIYLRLFLFGYKIMKLTATFELKAVIRQLLNEIPENVVTLYFLDIKSASFYFRS
jgi:hypothetical protein